MENKEITTAEEFTRLANNFYNEKGIVADYNRIGIDSHLFNYIAQNQDNVRKNKFKIALCCICINPPYWEFARPMLEGAKKLFLPGHNVDYFFWSDMPPNSIEGVNIIEAGAAEWPMPTLMRYTLILGQEEKLKEYDYIFFCDIDMKFVNVVGDEILPLKGGLTGAQHPMYAIRKEYWPPYEPNPESQAYIPRPGRVIIQEGKKRFEPLYFAGGFQGGASRAFIASMKRMKAMIDKDLNKSYIPIWNDESVWNKELFDNPPEVVLSPSYIYPDSLPGYYQKIWGREYQPKLVTLTKSFTTSKEGGEAVNKMMSNL